jgi:hypothetical protein
MKERMFIVFMVAGLLPVVMATLSASFILLDLSLLNPICWSKEARVASTAWVAFICVAILIGVANYYD